MLLLVLAVALPAFGQQSGEKHETTWLAMAKEMAAEIEADQDTGEVRTETTRVEERSALFGLLVRRYETPEELERYDRMNETSDKPGPPLAGKFDREILHWMDLEHFEDSHFSLDYRARLYCQADVGRQRDDMAFARQDLIARAQTMEFAPVGAALKYRRLDVSPRPRLPDTGEPFPRRLREVQAGVMFPWMLPPGLWNFTFGSASDRLFNSGDEMTADVTWLIGSGSPTSDDEIFAFFINWQNNRDYMNRTAMPGFVYRYKEGDRFTLVLGFPDNAVAWRPIEKLELAASYKFPRTVYSQIGYRPWKPLKIHAGFEWDSQRYFRHDRHHTGDRLWYLEKRLAAGLRWDITENVFFEAGGGYAFDRFWFEGETYSDRGFNRINLSDGPFLAFQFGVRF